MKKELRAVLAALLVTAAAAAVIIWSSGREEVISDRPPDLTIAFGEEECLAWRGGFQWEWPDGLTTQAVIADAPHPLDVQDDLPALNAAPGDTLVLAFGGVPDKVEVMYCQADTSALTAQTTFWQLSAGNQLVLPEDCAGTVWVIDAKWETGAATGRAQYAFSIS